MKRVFSILLILALTICCAQAESQTVDLNGLTLDELLALKSELDEAIMQAYAAQGPGEYAATREQPAPVGETVRYDGSFYLNPAVTDLTVTQVLRGEAAWARVQSWNSLNPKPGYGREYILVSLKAAAVASENDAQAEIYDYDFAFVSESGQTYEYAYAAGVAPELGGIYVGAETEGWIVGLVNPEDAPLLVYLPDSEHPIWFELEGHAPSAELPDHVSLEPLMRGDIGEAVREMQVILIELGYLNDTADGNFGKNTKAAVIAYQTAMGLTPTGIADEETLRLILTYSTPE